jgi:hypothetical protein
MDDGLGDYGSMSGGWTLTLSTSTDDCCTGSCLSGDVNGDKKLSVADIFFLISHLFAGGPPPLGCSDANGDGKIDVGDVFYLVNYLFAGGPAPK